MRMTPSDESVFLALNAKFRNELELVAFYDTGSTARVFHVRMPVGYDENLRVDRIVKVCRHDPSVLVFDEIVRAFQTEVKALISVSHTNVMSIYAAGTLTLGEDVSAPYYVMEYVPGACDLDVWLRAQAAELRSGDILDVLIQVGSGLEALHDARILHCDLKFGNLLVGAGRRVKIADLGFSKTIQGVPGITGVTTTLEPLPERYKDRIKPFADKRATRVELPRQELDASFDLHYLGWVIGQIRKMAELAGKFDRLEDESLTLISERLSLDVDEPRLPRYKSACEVLADLRKLVPVHCDRSALRELSPYTGTRTIRIPVTGSIPFPPRVQRVISHPLFLRLHSALQLGFTYYVFPGAAHTRFEHSLGVFANAARYISSLLADDYGPYFRQVVDEEKIETTLLAGLIHDVGQHSFAHSLEDLGLAPRHEDVAASFVTGDGIADLVPERFLEKGPLESVIENEWTAVNRERLLWIITNERTAGLGGDVGWEIMQSVVNGPLDADKTDYLLRDAHHAGVEYARSIDITRFMNSLTAGIVMEALKPRGALAITWKGQQSAENIILARSQMFWVLYWHHAVRAAHGMLGECAWEHLQGATVEVRRQFHQTLYCGTVGELLALLETSGSSRARELALALRQRRLYKRGIDLEYRDGDQLYGAMVKLKDDLAGSDPLLKRVAAKVAIECNKKLAEKGSRTRLESNDVMVDIPKGAKDKLGTVWVADPKGDHPRPYTSRAIQGTGEDWQNRVRTIRVFVAPRIERDDRETIRQHGPEILGKLI